MDIETFHHKAVCNKGLQEVRGRAVCLEEENTRLRGKSRSKGAEVGASLVCSNSKKTIGARKCVCIFLKYAKKIN